MSHRIIAALFGVLALLLAGPGNAQVGKLLDFNAASPAELGQLPNVTPAIAGEIMKKRPYKTIVELNKVLVDQKLNADQIKAVYAKAFVPININTGAREEFLLIPGVGAQGGDAVAPVQERPRVGARDLDHAAIGEKCRFHAFVLATGCDRT